MNPSSFRSEESFRTKSDGFLFCRSFIIYYRRAARKSLPLYIRPRLYPPADSHEQNFKLSNELIEALQASWRRLGHGGKSQIAEAAPAEISSFATVKRCNSIPHFSLSSSAPVR
jgi:hypothetical protein